MMGAASDMVIAALREELAELTESYGKMQTGEDKMLHRVIAERDAAEQRNAELVAILSEHEWADWEPYDSHNTRAGGCYCIECGNHKEVGHDDDCKIAAAIKPTESGASE